MDSVRQIIKSVSKDEAVSNELKPVG